MGYYPICLELKNRRCVVFGGGAIAERKVGSLLHAAAAATVISPVVTRQLRQWAQRGEIRHLARKYTPGDLAGYELALVATNDPRVNATVSAEAKARGIWVNAADDPAHCDFILPAVLRRGTLVITVSTGGKAPALARSLREELARQFPEGYGLLVEIAAQVRDELRRHSRRPDFAAWRTALSGEIVDHIRRGDPVRAKDFLLRKLGGSPCE